MKIKAFLIAVLLCAAVLSSCSSPKDELHTAANLAGEYSFSGMDSKIYFYQNEDGSATMDICNEKGKTVQTFEFPEESEYYLRLSFDYAFKHISVTDMDFDGCNDLYVPCSIVSQNLEGMCWLWNSKTKTLELSEELTALPELTSYVPEKRLKSCDNTAEGGAVYNYYEWIDGALTLVRTESVPEGDAQNRFQDEIN